MEIKLYEGDFLDLRKYGFEILSKEIILYVDNNNVAEASILKALGRSMLLEIYQMNMAKMLIQIDGYQQTFICSIPKEDISIIREYKIISVNENRDQNGDYFLIVNMAHIVRNFNETWDGKFNWYNTFSLDDLDTFIFPLDCEIANNIENFPEQNIYINFNDYDDMQILYDGKHKKCYKYIAESKANMLISNKILSLKSANKGGINEEDVIFRFLSELRGYSINLTSDRISVFNSNETIIDSVLKKIEENGFSITYIGNFKTGIEFRLVTLGKTTETIIKSRNEKPFITIGSKNLKGYAVTYELE